MNPFRVLIIAEDGIRDDTLDILKAENTAVLLVTHEPEEAMRMADEIALMRTVRLYKKGPHIMCTTPQLIEKQWRFFGCQCDSKPCFGIFNHTAFGQFFAPGHADGTQVDIAFRPNMFGLILIAMAKVQITPSQGVAASGNVIDRVLWEATVWWNFDGP